MNAVVGKDPNSMWPDSIYGMKKLDWIRSVLIGGAPSKSLWLVDVLGQSPQQIQDTVVKILCESNLFISAFEIKRPKPKPPVEPKLPSAINFFKEANKREFSLLPKAKAEEKLSKMWSDCDDKALYEAKLAQAMPKYEASLKKFKQDMKEYVKLYGEVKQAHLSKNNASSGGVAKNSRGESLDEARLKEVEIIMATYNMQRKKEAKLAGRPKGRMSAFEQEREYDAIVMELRDKILEMDTSVMTKDLALQQIKKLGPQCPRNAEDSVPDETMKLNHAWPGWKIYGGRGVDPLLTKASGEMILDEKLGERPIFQERAVYVMSTIPALRIRCELQETMLECQENVTSLRERVDVIQLCLRELRGADKLAYFLKISLSIGNFLNAQKDALGRFPAPRDGLNISGFTAFAELKSNDRRWALSDFAVMFYRQLRPEDLRFYEELLPKVHSARAINPIKLDQDIDKLHKGVKSVEEALKTIDKCYEVPGVVDQFHAAIQSEIEELRLKDFEKQQLDMMDQFESVAQYYCVDPFHFSFTESPMQIMFDDILSVLESDGMYIQALGKLEMREKMEERKRLKAQQKAREAEAKKHAVSAKQGARSVGKGNDRSKTQVALPSRSEFNNEFQDMLKGRRNLKRNQGI